MNAEHMLNLSSRLDAAQNPKDELAAILQDVVRMLPRAVNMLQEAGRSGAGGVYVRVPFAIVSEVGRVGIKDVCTYTLLRWRPIVCELAASA